MVAGGIVADNITDNSGKQVVSGKIISGRIEALNYLVRHYSTLFPSEEIAELFEGSGIIINRDTGLISSYNPVIEDIWNYFFEIIYSKKGLRWIALVDGELHRIRDKYGFEYPSLYNSSFYQFEQKCETLEKEKAALIENLRTLKLEYENSMYKDPLAQVYKEDIFRQNLVSDATAWRDLGIEFAFFIIETDNLVALNIRYGRNEGDELLANSAYLLKNFKKSSRDYAHHLIFRMNGPRFTYYCTDVSRDEVIGIAERIRTEFRESKLFIENITISSGLVHSSEFNIGERDPLDFSGGIIDIANSRLRLAKHRGGDSVCSESETDACFDNESYIMVIDPDDAVCYMIEAHLKSAGFNVVTCAMGDEALERIDVKAPTAIISALMLPKMDGFSLRKKLLEDSALKDIPFIMTSAVKDEKSIIRAHSLGIFHFLKKPYSIVELSGLIKNIVKDKM